MKHPIPLLIALAFLGGCSAEEPDQKAEQAKAEDGAIVQAVEAQQQVAQKAKDLEKQLQEAHEKQKKAIDEQTDDG